MSIDDLILIGLGFLVFVFIAILVYLRRKSEYAQEDINNVLIHPKKTVDRKNELRKEKISDKTLGIDFGTSKSVAALYEGGKITIIPDPQDHTSIPSLVMVAPEEKLYVGWDALNHPARYQSQHFTISSVKRMMGKAGVTSWANLKTYPQEVSALILGCLKVQAEAFYKEKIGKAVLAVPAHFNINQRWATKQAAEIAGLEPYWLVNEATAAVLAYSMIHARKDALAVVFDFGGGTLDVSIVETGEGVVEVKATEGDDQLGGDDFDQAIIAFLVDKIERDFGPSVELSPMHYLVLREAAVQAKIDLSRTLVTQIYIPAFISTASRHYNLDLSLERSTFESLCQPLFDRAKNLLQQGLVDSNLEPSNLHYLLLIGGTSYIPRVRALVSEVTGLRPSYGFDPASIVAQGAAIFAAYLSGDIKDILLLDATQRSYSVGGLEDGKVAFMIPRNTTIPTKKTEIFTTSIDNQEHLTLRVFEGEQSLASQNTFIGEVCLTGLLPAKAGNPQIEVTFDIDSIGILHVSALERVTGHKVEATMLAPYRLNDAQIKVLRRKVEKELILVSQRYRIAYEEKQYEQAHGEATACINDIERFLIANRTALSTENVRLLIAGQDLLREFLAREVDCCELNKLIASVRHTYEEAVRSLMK